MLESVTGAALTAAVASFVWVAALGTRVSVLEAEHKALKEWMIRIEEKLDVVVERRHS